MPRLEEYPRPREECISVVRSPQDIVDLTDQITSRLDRDSLSVEKTNQALKVFLQCIYGTPGLTALAVVDQKKRFFRPTLDIHILWSSPIDYFSESQMQAMDEVDNGHAHFLRITDSYLDSFVNNVDPRRCPSLKDLANELSGRFGSDNILVLANLER